ncbi:hypothetical protein [Brevundimonas sp.]
MSDYQPGGYNDPRGLGGPPPSTGLAVGSLVTGIIAAVLALIPVIGFISWILAPAGLIMGVIAVNKPAGKGLAIGGIVTSVIALLLCIGWVVLFGAAMGSAATSDY